jgi:hypothetical protein
VHGTGAAHAQPVHARVSLALVPAVLRFGNALGHAALPLIVMQEESPVPDADLRAQTSPPLQPPPVPCGWHMRPFVSPPLRFAPTAQDVGPAGGVAIARVDSAMLAPSAVHPVWSTGAVVVAGVTAQAASLALAIVKFPVSHFPPTASHEQVQVAVASPAATCRSTAVSPNGQLGRAAAAYVTAGQPAGTDSHA